MARSTEFQLAISLTSKARSELGVAELDEQIVRYLNLLDEYNGCYEELQSYLRSAKVILGPRRVGRDSYDLSVRQAQITMEERDDGREIEAEGWTRPSEDVSQLSGRPALVLVHNRHHQQASPLDHEPDPTPIHNLRNRRPHPGSPPPISPLLPPSNLLPDPILQFAPLPPPPLRTAQHAFHNALQPIIRLSNLRSQLFLIENQIHSLKISLQNPPPS
ncbi:hypothetical protein VP01_1g3 [Puccinia sorghi]|uniref:Vacuolar ATPase assembly protein VMA22 n=1 Tax=Puccinia sorghi TaxID=27349 RepID=A0A0L6VBA0_9BASI|nr:hypothetical protein VP01_1g3 [Puccinia sorghi]